MCGRTARYAAVQTDGPSGPRLGGLFPCEPKTSASMLPHGMRECQAKSPGASAFARASLARSQVVCAEGRERTPLDVPVVRVEASVVGAEADKIGRASCRERVCQYV